MKKISLIPCILALAGSMMLGSCGEDVAGGAGATGSIAPAVSVDGILLGADVSSKAAASDPAPEVGDLSLTVTSDDGSLVRTWDRLSDFSADEKFPVGYYNVEVGYGDSSAEGFECTPAYYASQRIKVIEAVTVPVALTAVRTHAEVNISYTDAFKSYVSRATTRLESESGHKSYFVTSSTFTEDRSSLIVPGKTAVYVSLTKQNGAEANDLKVAEFTSLARHRYNITIDVNEGGVGGPRLTVDFDDTVEAETVEVDLTDEKIFAPAPELTIEGVDNDGYFEFVEHSYTGSPVKIGIIAAGGIKSVVLNTKSAFLRDKKGLPPTLELVGNEGNHGVSNCGIVVRGLDGTVDKMAVIDFTDMFDTYDFLDSDAVYDHVSTFSVEVTDKNGKTAEAPVGFSMKLLPIEMSVNSTSELKFFDTEVTAEISYNGNPDKLSFVYVNDLGSDKPLTVVGDIVAKGENKYSVSLSGLPADVNPVTIKVKAGIKSASLTVDRVIPEFSLSVQPNDVYAHRAYVTLECAEFSADQLAPYVTFYKGSTRLTATRIEGGTYLIEGLASDLDNTLTASLVGNSAKVCSPVTFHTEAARMVIDGAFDVWSSEKKGDYQYLWKVGTTGAWATLNDLTTSQSGSGSGSAAITGGCSYKSTSGTIPANGRSTKSFASGGLAGTTKRADGHTDGKSDIHTDKAYNGSANAVLIRTVGWGKSNSAKAGTSQNQGFNRCDNMTPGELYVGTYNGGPQYGVEFKSRPSALKFYYHYDPVTSGNGDFGTAEIAVYDNEGNKISSNKVELREQATYKEVNMPLTYNKGCEKAAKISIIFRSSENAAALEKDTTFWHTPGGNNTSGGEYVGSELYIDDVELIY